MKKLLFSGLLFLGMFGSIHKLTCKTLEQILAEMRAAQEKNEQKQAQSSTPPEKTKSKTSTFYFTEHSFATQKNSSEQSFERKIAVFPATRDEFIDQWIKTTGAVSVGSGILTHMFTNNAYNQWCRPWGKPTLPLIGAVLCGATCIRFAQGALLLHKTKSKETPLSDQIDEEWNKIQKEQRRREQFTADLIEKISSLQKSSK